MLRNLNLSSSGRRICGTTHLGVRAADIPTGFPIPSMLADAVGAGDPADCEYSIQILSTPPGLDLRVAENGSYIAMAADGSYSGGRRIRKSGVTQLPDSTYTINIGTAPTMVSADLAAAYSVRARVDSSLVANYAVAARVSADLLASYASKARVSADLACSYTIAGLQRVSADLAAQYFIQAGDTDITVPPSRTVNFDGGTNRVDFDGGTNRVDF